MVFKLGIRKLGPGPCQALAMIFTSRKLSLGNLVRVIISATWKDSRREIFLAIAGEIVTGWEMVY